MIQIVIINTMKVSRNFSLAVQYLLDEWLPPVLRDAKWFMYLPMRLVVREHAREFMTFKSQAFRLSEAEFSGVYERTASVNELQGETDLNAACTEEILASLAGQTVLEVGCGRGYLARRMAQTHQVTASDIIVSPALEAALPQVTFVAANIESLPFGNGEFDTVVCTHTLEHVQHLELAVRELRRVTRRRLIIVVPRQRPYKYTFSLHINFFPYDWSLVGQFGYRPGAVIKRLGDWYYQEDIQR
jgi:ubiquinone/menaquinone biosynthesis C-methylase UbiE